MSVYNLLEREVGVSVTLHVSLQSLEREIGVRVTLHVSLQSFGVRVTLDVKL